MSRSSHPPSTNPPPRSQTNDSLPPSEPAERQQIIAQITDIIVENRTWMLSTCGSDHIIRTRPMLNVNETFAGDLYLFARNDDPAVNSIRENPQVNVAISEPKRGRYVSITGEARLLDDVKKAELLWNERCGSWFGIDRPDPTIGLIQVDVTDIESWEVDQDMLTRIGNFFRPSSTPSPSQVEHQKVEWSEAGSGTGSGNAPISETLLNHHGEGK